MMIKLSLALLSFLSATTVRAQEECGPAGFAIAGSSTVYPIAVAWRDAYLELCPGLDITVEEDGSSNGAARVCDASDEGASAVDIGDMSRDWESDEGIPQANGYIYDCAAGDTSRSAIQIDVALDGLSVTAVGAGTAASCIETLGGLTLHQLRWMFTSYSDAELEATGWDPASVPNNDGNESTHLWSELDASCEASEISIAGPNEDSGTHEYFAETVSPTDGMICVSTPVNYHRPQQCSHNQYDRQFYFFRSFLTWTTARHMIQDM